MATAKPVEPQKLRQSSRKGNLSAIGVAAHSGRRESRQHRQGDEDEEERTDQRLRERHREGLVATIGGPASRATRGG